MIETKTAQSPDSEKQQFPQSTSDLNQPQTISYYQHRVLPTLIIEIPFRKVGARRLVALLKAGWMARTMCLLLQHFPQCKLFRSTRLHYYYNYFCIFFVVSRPLYLQSNDLSAFTAVFKECCNVFVNHFTVSASDSEHDKLDFFDVNTLGQKCAWNATKVLPIYFSLMP